MVQSDSPGAANVQLYIESQTTVAVATSLVAGYLQYLRFVG